MMNTGAHKEALENFEALLSTLGTDDQLVKFQVHLNLAACRRRLGDVAGAVARLNTVLAAAVASCERFAKAKPFWK
jgi:hypothetical protein